MQEVRSSTLLCSTTLFRRESHSESKVFACWTQFG